MIQTYLFNGYRRIAAQAPYFVIPFALGESATWSDVDGDPDAVTAGYGIYSWANSYNEWQNSKAGHLALSGEHH
jgi:ubiquinol-cytochrome c reductase subunit 8